MSSSYGVGSGSGSGGISSRDAASQLDALNRQKTEDVVTEANETMKQELVTAKAGRTKSLRFA